MVLGGTEKAASQQLSRWKNSGFIERVAQGQYKKLIAQIV